MKVSRHTPPQATPDTRLRWQPVHELDAIRDEWNDLPRTTGNVFATWEWASTWWRHFGGSRRLLVTACRTGDGRLAAILPFYRWMARPVQVIRLLGHDAGDQLGPICRAEDREVVAFALKEVLARAGGVFIGEQLAAAEGWSRRLGATVLSHEGSPALSLDGRSWDEYLAAKSRNFREQVRRRERKLIREHDLRFRLSADEKRFDADLDQLFRLHRERWGRTKTGFSEREAFHREFALHAFRRGWLRLWFAELNGECAAAWYGFRFCGVESYYQAGRAARWEDASIGFVLLAHSIREAFDDGMREYRFLRGGEDFKYRFADADPGLETIALAQGGVGRLAVRSGTALRRLRRFLASR